MSAVLRIERFDSWEKATALRTAWDAWAAELPFSGWTWLTHWWRFYGQQHSPDRRLCVLGVFDDSGRVRAVAPLYHDRSAPWGGIVRLLGDGEACSDYLTFPCDPTVRAEASAALAHYMVEELSHQLSWNVLELIGPAADDPTMSTFVRALAERGCPVHRRDGPNCWAIALPTTMDDYRARLPAKRRKRLDRLAEEHLSSGRAIVRMSETRDQIEQALDLLIAMHQRRRRSLGEPGCYSSPAFEAFIRSVVPELVAEGKAQLAVLEIDGRPAATDLVVLTHHAVCAYQGAIEPEMVEHEPGKLLHWSLVRWAIREGYRTYDFLRGDEPYKAQFGAQPHPITSWRIAAPHFGARVRHRLWSAARDAKRLLRACGAPKLAGRIGAWLAGRKITSLFGGRKPAPVA